VKFNPVRGVLDGKRVVVVDDSIVRGTTCRARIRNLRQAGAREIHMRVSCPPICFPCFYGIDFPTRGELIAATHSIEEIRGFLEVESLGYLSLDGLLEAVRAPEDFCHACFSGRYPTLVAKEADKLAMEKTKGRQES
jgi:amidophosphoribosyltransferase